MPWSSQVKFSPRDASDISLTLDESASERAVADLHKAIKDRRWLVVLNAHAAPALILDMLHALSLSSYLIRGEGAGSFRLFLATPHVALFQPPSHLPATFQPPSHGIPLTLRAQGMRVAMTPYWGSLGATAGTGSAARVALRATCQTLAHPHASYLGFYNKDTSREIQVATLTTVLAMSTLSR